MDEEDDVRLTTFKAMNLACKVFERYLSRRCYDPGYWAIRLTAWKLSADTFEPLEKMEIDTREGKE